MANKIEQNKSPAESAYVANEACQVLVAQMMTEMHGKRDISVRQRVAHCIRPEDWNLRGNGWAWLNIGADNFDSQPAAYLLQHETRAASHIQYPADRQRITVNGADYIPCVTQPMMHVCDVPVCAFD